MSKNKVAEEKKNTLGQILRIKRSVNGQWNIRAVQNVGILVMVAWPDKKWSPKSLEQGNERERRREEMGPLLEYHYLASLFGAPNASC